MSIGTGEIDNRARGEVRRKQEQRVPWEGLEPRAGGVIGSNRIIRSDDRIILLSLIEMS